MTAPLRHSHSDRGLDPYFSPPESVRALAAIERLPRRIFDPACGDGRILNILEEMGHQVSGADIVDYGWPETIQKDYLSAPSDLSATSIVTNPPSVGQ